MMRRLWLGMGRREQRRIENERLFRILSQPYYKSYNPNQTSQDIFNTALTNGHLNLSEGGYGPFSINTSERLQHSCEMRDCTFARKFFLSIVIPFLKNNATVHTLTFPTNLHYVEQQLFDLYLNLLQIKTVRSWRQIFILDRALLLEFLNVFKQANHVKHLYICIRHYDDQFIGAFLGNKHLRRLFVSSNSLLNTDFLLLESRIGTCCCPSLVGLFIPTSLSTNTFGVQMPFVKHFRLTVTPEFSRHLIVKPTVSWVLKEPIDGKHHSTIQNFLLNRLSKQILNGQRKNISNAGFIFPWLSDKVAYQLVQRDLRKLASIDINFPSNRLLDELRKHPNYFCDSLTPKGLQAFSQVRNLHSVVIHISKTFENSDETSILRKNCYQIIKALMHFSQIKNLTLTNVLLTDENVKILARGLTSLTTLSLPSMVLDHHFSYAGLRCLCRLPSLRQLIIPQIKMQDSTLKTLLPSYRIKQEKLAKKKIRCIFAPRELPQALQQQVITYLLGNQLDIVHQDSRNKLSARRYFS